MAVADRNVINMAKVYSRELNMGRSGAEARETIATTFGGATEQQINAAIYEAQRGRETGERIANLKGGQRLWEALGEEDTPGSRVGVRVRVDIERANGTMDHYSLYLDMSWADKKSQIAQEVADYLNQRQDKGYAAKKTTWVMEGPTRWPVQVE